MIKIIRKIPLILVYVAIIYFSIKTPTVQTVKFNNIDKLYHFIAYFSLGFSVNLAFYSKNIKALFLGISLALGISLEFIQGMLPYRDMSFADGVTNALGLFAGVLIFTLCYKQVYWVFKKLKLSRVFLDQYPSKGETDEK